MTTILQIGVMTRRGALALTLALAAGTRIRPVAATSSSGSWTSSGNPARTRVFPSPGLDIKQEIVERWVINDRFVQTSGVCDGIAYYMPIPYNPGDSFGQLFAVDARTGAELWQHDPPQTDPPSSFFGGIVIADGLLIASAGNLLVGIDAKTGAERWIFDLQGHADWANPAIVDGVLYLSDSTSVNAIKLDDTPAWLWEKTLGDGATTVVGSTVSVDGDDLIVTSRRPANEAAPDGPKAINIHVLNRADGNERYRYELQAGGGAQQIAVQQGMLFGLASVDAYEQDFYFVLATDGVELWRFALPDFEDVSFSTPEVTGNLVVCSAGDRLLGLDATTGETVWTSAQLEPLSSALVLIDDVIYIGSDSLTSTGTIYVISAIDGSLLTSFATGSGRSHVVGITDGMLIASVGTRGMMMAFANAPGKAERGDLKAWL